MDGPTGTGRAAGAVCVVDVRVAPGAPAERVAAEAWSSGASGLEEREAEDGRVSLLIYAPAAAIDAVCGAIADARVPDVAIGAVRPADDRDWGREWQRGLEAVEVGARLVVRPSFVARAGDPARVELVIDPGQAFGTGGHASTRLALEVIAAAADAGAFARGARVLDVGVGTGVLALAALALGAARAVGFDLDPEAGRASRVAAVANGLDDRFDVFVGGVDALGAAQFDWVFANLLKREMLPIAGALARATRPGGRAVFSGLLATEREEVDAALRAEGFACAGVRTDTDANGDAWLALLMARS